MRSYLYFLFILPWQKISSGRGKFILLSLPVILLAAFLTGANTLNTSFAVFIEQQILPVIKNAETVITLNDSLGEQDMTFDPRMQTINQDQPKYKYFKQSEIDNLQSVDGIKTVGPGLASSELLATSSQLVNGQSILFDRFSGLAQSTAQHLELEHFEYQPGQALPMVIGLDAVKQYKIDPSAPDHQNSSFLTGFQKANTLLETVSDKVALTALIGQEFDIQVGGLAWQPVVYRVAGDVRNTFAYIPSPTAATLYQQYLDKLNQYWHVDQIKQGLTVRVKIVGVDGTISPSAVSIPNQAIAAIHQRLAAQLQQAQRPGRLVPTQQLGKDFRGISVKDNQPSADGGYLWYIDLPNQSQQLPPVFVPGLYYQAAANQQSAQLLTPTQVSQISFPIDQLTVVVNNLDQKVDVGNKLFFSGYQQGKSTPFHYSQVLSFTQVVSQTTRIISIAFVVVALITTFFLTIRSVKTSEYDIGVARLLGATQGHTLVLFCGFFVQQLLLAIVVGCLTSYVIIQATSPIIANILIDQNQFQSQQILATYGRHITISIADFYHLDWLQLLTDLSVVIALSIVGLLCAALLASRIQPFVLVNNNRQ